MLSSLSFGNPKRVAVNCILKPSFTHSRLDADPMRTRPTVERFTRRLEPELCVQGEFSGGGIQRWGKPAAPAPTTGGEYPENSPLYLFHASHYLYKMMAMPNFLTVALIAKSAGRATPRNPAPEPSEPQKHPTSNLEPPTSNFKGRGSSRGSFGCRVGCGRLSIALDPALA